MHTTSIKYHKKYIVNQSYITVKQFVNHFISKNSIFGLLCDHLYIQNFNKIDLFEDRIVLIDHYLISLMITALISYHIELQTRYYFLDDDKFSSFFESSSNIWYSFKMFC